MRFAFSFTEDETPEREMSLSFTVDDGEPWHAVLHLFNDFLSGVYGYRIDKIDALVSAEDTRRGFGAESFGGTD